jgi:hypothetical protein
LLRPPSGPAAFFFVQPENRDTVEIAPTAIATNTVFLTGLLNVFPQVFRICII